VTALETQHPDASCRRQRRQTGTGTCTTVLIVPNLCGVWRNTDEKGPRFFPENRRDGDCTRNQLGDVTELHAGGRDNECSVTITVPPPPPSGRRRHRRRPVKWFIGACVGPSIRRARSLNIVCPASPPRRAAPPARRRILRAAVTMNTRIDFAVCRSAVHCRVLLFFRWQVDARGPRWKRAKKKRPKLVPRAVMDRPHTDAHAEKDRLTLSANSGASREAFHLTRCLLVGKSVAIWPLFLIRNDRLFHWEGKNRQRLDAI